VIQLHSEKAKRKIRRLLVLSGVFCSVSSVFALLLSLPMPGVGWLLAALVLMAVSLLTPWIGRSYVTVSLIVSVFHLFTFGPLSLLQSESPFVHLPTFYLLFFIVVPLGIAFLSIFLPMCARRGNTPDKY